MHLKFVDSGTHPASCATDAWSVASWCESSQRRDSLNAGKQAFRNFYGNPDFEFDFIFIYVCLNNTTHRQKGSSQGQLKAVYFVKMPGSIQNAYIALKFYFSVFLFIVVYIHKRPYFFL